MGKELRLMDVTKKNLQTAPCCGIKNTEHQGHRRKTNWAKMYLEKGWKAKALLTEKNIQAGFIEYIPGQYAWRGVDAEGYMLIHCIWTYFRQYKRQGYGLSLVQAAIDDAKKAKMRGVAVVTRKKPWLAGRELFIKNGFDVVDTAPPDYELLVKKFNKSAPDPKFKGLWEEKLKKYSRGLTIIRSNQCPHIAKFADDIAAVAKKTYGLIPKIVELKTYRDAQNAPTPYAVFAIIYNGRLLADHQISKTRFRNIMNKVL